MLKLQQSAFDTIVMIFLGCFSYHPKDPSMNSETYHYKRGANQVFSQSTHLFVPSKYSEEEVGHFHFQFICFFGVLFL